MRYIILVFMIVSVFNIFGCSGNGASELFETAKFEELQNNKEHALKLYQDIIRKHPQSEFADKAKERMSALNTDK